MHSNTTDNATSFADSSEATGFKKFGDSAAYFDGDGDYLSIDDHVDWDFGAGEFTIDFWMKPNMSANGNIINNTTENNTE